MAEGRVTAAKLQVKFPPGMFAKGVTNKRKRTIIQQTDIPLAFRRSKGRVIACFVDVVVDVVEDGRTVRRTLHQYILSVKGSDGQLLLRPLETKIVTVPPAFAVNALSLSTAESGGEEGEESEDDVEGEDEADEDAEGAEESTDDAN